jgi:hypothetical protein
VTTPDHPDTAVVCIVNGHRCSAGTGPGTATLPWDEAKALVGAGYAVYGLHPPPNMGIGARPVSPP